MAPITDLKSVLQTFVSLRGATTFQALQTGCRAARRVTKNDGPWYGAARSASGVHRNGICGEGALCYVRTRVPGEPENCRFQDDPSYGSLRHGRNATFRSVR